MTTSTGKNELLYGPDDHPVEEKGPHQPVRCRLIEVRKSGKVTTSKTVAVVEGNERLIVDGIACDGVVYVYQCTAYSEERHTYERVYRKLPMVRVKVILCSERQGDVGKLCEHPRGHAGPCSWVSEARTTDEKVVAP